MKILAIDTATEACSVSLALDGRQLDRYRELERGHAEQLLPMVQELLAEGGVTLRSLDAIAFGRGPGGFTGVRLAASVAQGLAYGAGIGVVPVSDLAAIAERVLGERAQVDRVLVVNDARMREVYWCAFRRDGAPAPLGLERVGAHHTVELPAPGAPWIAAGRGLVAWPALADRCNEAGAELMPDLLPRAAEVLSLAKREVAAGRILPPTDALPVYVRDNVAEIPS